MENSKIVVGLDIGTTAIKAVVSEASNNQLNIIGVGSSHSEGLSRGIIVDIDQTTEAIKVAVKKAAEQSNTDIKDVVIGLPSNGVQIQQCQGMIAIGDQSKEIDDNDVKNVMSAALIQNLPPEQEYISLIPNSFSVDGFKNIKDPRGMIGIRLEFNGILYSIPKSIVHNAERSVERAGLNVIHEVIAPAALSQVALDNGERNFGSVIIDFGGGQCTASVIHDQKLKFTTIDPEGGELITHDISVVLNTTMDSAAQLQRYYGNADSSQVSDSEKFPVKIVGKDQPQIISNKYLSEIIEARVKQIFGRLKKSLQSVKALDLPGGIVLTGGVAELPGVENIARQVFGVKVRTYVPTQMGLRHPAFAESLGLISYAQNLNDLDIIARNVVHGDNQETVSASDEDSSEDEEVEYTRKPTPKRKQEKTKEKPKSSTTSKLKSFWDKFFD